MYTYVCAYIYIYICISLSIYISLPAVSRSCSPFPSGREESSTEAPRIECRSRGRNADSIYDMILYDIIYYTILCYTILYYSIA